MHPILRNILTFIVSLFAGMMVNGFIISISGSIIPPPKGVDIKTIEGLKAGIHLFESKHFIFPFLAHALGTFVGAALVSLFAASHKMKLALGIGLLSLVGGTMMVFMLPAPMWYNIVDLTLAYIPMAYLGAKLFDRKK